MINAPRTGSVGTSEQVEFRSLLPTAILLRVWLSTETGASTDSEQVEVRTVSGNVALGSMSGTVSQAAFKATQIVLDTARYWIYDMGQRRADKPYCRGENMFRRLACCIGIVLASMALPQNAAAQDCGTGCQSCGFIGKEGTNYSAEDGLWNMSCANFSLSCGMCAVGRANNGADAEEILRVIARGSERELRRVIETHRNRLSVSTSRSLVVLRGTSCDVDAVGAVVFLSSERTALLRRLSATPMQTSPAHVLTR